MAFTFSADRETNLADLVKDQDHDVPPFACYGDAFRPGRSRIREQIPHIILGANKRVHRSPPGLEGMMECDVVFCQLIRVVRKSLRPFRIRPLKHKGKQFS
jgi:hypothetical protein